MTATLKLRILWQHGDTVHQARLHRKIEAGAAYTAAAHLRYISRQSATVYRYAERMPLQWHAAQRFLNEREDSIRKNGRVIDKLVISIPREMTMDQAVDTIRNFGFQLSDGRAPFYFTIQDWDSHNPHCHFIYVDQSVEDGARVFKTTERDSSERIKALWENVCNKHLQELGIDASISFADAAEKKAQRLEDDTYANDNAPLPIKYAETEQTTPLVDQTEISSLPPDAPLNEFEEEDEELIPAEEDAEDAPEGDDDMPLNRKLDLARRQAAELRTMRSKRADVARLRTEYAYWSGEAVTARQKAEMANNAVTDAVARSLLAERSVKETHFMGFKRGINLKLGPFQIKTAGFEKAVQAEAEYAKATYAEALRSADFREANSYANRATQKVFELEQRVSSLEQHITMHERINGEEQDFDEAEVYFRDSLGQLLEGVSPNDVMDAYERDDLTLEEAKDLLQEMGHPDLATWIQEEDQGIRH